MEKMNFTDLLKKYDSIVIPKIQRDYAQGRSDKKAEAVRNNLLNDIFIKDKPVDFDFIFGTKNKNRNDFIPLDGQQRLTTLYLLYLYAVKVKKENFKDLKLEKFSYDTRHAAKNFCKAIVENDWNISDKPISESIKNSTWFMDYWQYDPTVEGMLTMLDAIHEKAKSRFYPELDKITFYFFDMDEHGLDENLYLKMNSRGKPLTSFENLKADIDSILPSDFLTDSFDCLVDNKNCGNSLAEKWKYYIDRDWTDFFWNYKDENNLVDSAFVRFMANVLACYWAVNKKQDEKKEVTEETIEHITESGSVFSLLTNMTGNEDFIDFSSFKSVLNLKGAFAFLARTLSIFSKFYESINKNSYPAWKDDDESSISEKICKGTVTNKIRVIFFAIASYPQTDFESDSFKHWMRVVWNIVENANLNGVSELRLIHNLSEKISQIDIYEVLRTYEVKENDFASEQVKEETAKAKQILDENRELRKYEGKCKKKDGSAYNTWEDIIQKAEKYAFFKGAIRFLFTKEEIGDDWNDFDTKWDNAKKYFDENGVKDFDKQYKSDSILLKALISSCSDDSFWKSLWWNKSIFNNTAENWRALLLNYSWIVQIHDILLGCVEIAKNSIENPSIKILIDAVCKDKGVLNFISTERQSARIRSTNRGFFAFWESRYPKYMVPYIPFLHEMAIKKDIEYRDICKIKESHFATCNDETDYGIDFTYGKHNFRFYMYPSETIADVYLLDKEWKYVPTGEETNDDHKNYICFDCNKDISKHDFISLLNDKIENQKKAAKNQNMNI